MMKLISSFKLKTNYLYLFSMEFEMSADFSTCVVAVHIDLIATHVEDISVKELQILLVDVR